MQAYALRLLRDPKCAADTDSLAACVGRTRTDYPHTDELMKYCDSAKAYFTLANT